MIVAYIAKIQVGSHRHKLQFFHLQVWFTGGEMRIVVAPLPGLLSILLDAFALGGAEVPCLLFELCGTVQRQSEAMGFAAETALFGLMTPT